MTRIWNQLNDRLSSTVLACVGRYRLHAITTALFYSVSKQRGVFMSNNTRSTGVIMHT